MRLNADYTGDNFLYCDIKISIADLHKPAVHWLKKNEKDRPTNSSPHTTEESLGYWRVNPIIDMFYTIGDGQDCGLMESRFEGSPEELAMAFDFSRGEKEVYVLQWQWDNRFGG